MKYTDKQLIIPFGMYKGESLENVAKINYKYLIYLATVPPYEFKTERDKQLYNRLFEITTLEERNHKRQEREDRKNRLNNAKWLITFIEDYKKELKNKKSISYRFCKRVQYLLLKNGLLDQLSTKELKWLFDMWCNKEEAQHTYEKREQFRKDIRCMFRRNTKMIDRV